MTNFFKQIFRKQSNNTEKESEAVCPYCKGVLKQKPQRKKKCPFCNNDIYVRSKQKVFSSTLLTREDAIAVDCLKNLENIGIKIKDNDFKTKKRELSIKFGKEAKSSDVIWGLFNELILKMKDLHSLKMIYYEMALFLNKLGKDCFAVLQQSAKMELMKFKQDGFIKKVRILTAGEDSCEACRWLENQVFTIEEALEKMPIPCKECTYKLYDEKRGFCRCCYAAEIG
jgi:hypothetical protein